MRRAVTSSTLAAVAGSLATPSTPSNTTSNISNSIRHMHIPGWKTTLSTGDSRSKEQREADRKARHLDKLPRPVALHAPQYPFERHVLADHIMQPTVFENDLDTSGLYHPEPPGDFFIYWNINDFNRTEYPAVPKVDYRYLAPYGRQWRSHVEQAQCFLRKHKVVPTYFSGCPHDVNMSAVFSGSFDVRARTDDEGKVVPPPAPETSMHPRNFWYTAHYGNYIELHDLQQAPSIFFKPPKAAVKEEAYYTFVMASPDYPYRTDPDATFLLNYVVANIPASGVATAARTGTVVVPYCPPLPTEDAGSARQLCMLYKQTKKIDDLNETTAADEKALLPFAQRSSFRFHDNKSASGKALRENFKALTSVEEVLPSLPSTINMFNTKWDIQVQEYYERIGEAEPAYTEGEETETALTYLARSRESFQVRSRYLADGTLNQGTQAQFFVQNADTKIGENTSWAYRSKRHMVGHNGREKILPVGGARLF